MNIVKFKKGKKNTYEIYFDDDSSTTLYDDVIIKYNLLVNKNISEKKFEEIYLYNSLLDNYYNAIKYVNKKLRTELEIKKFLNKKQISEIDIDKIIELLYKDGYLNKERYLNAYINDQYNLTSNGPNKVKKELIELGYSEEEIDNKITNLDWNKNLEKIINKKIKLNSKGSNNNLKNKILNDIIKLGYEQESIICFLDNIDFISDENNLKRELNKIYKKYSLKYKENELEFKVINYLYRKGYNIEDIKRCLSNYEE